MQYTPISRAQEWVWPKFWPTKCKGLETALAMGKMRVDCTVNKIGENALITRM